MIGGILNIFRVQEIRSKLLITAGFLLALTRRWDRHPAFVPAAGVIGLLWANLHGAFFIGILLFGVVAAARAVSGARRDAARALATVAVLGIASLMNPYGVRLWGFIRQSAAIPRPYLPAYRKQCLQRGLPPRICTRSAWHWPETCGGVGTRKSSIYSAIWIRSDGVSWITTRSPC